ncbi:uncharacterized protein LOC135370350 isoform X2 [Ornithodoros turicata]|uniref:uncharacterized protein LOC135370350 isoform X2 n=1 Tax=Ornithodoros turicata TaxID=34597 RepID=UPI00313A28C1
MGEEEGTAIVGLRKHPRAETQNTYSVRGAFYSASGMGEEEGTPIVGLRKHQGIEWESNKEHRKLASENKKRWNGRRGANSWSQKTPRDGMGEEEGTPKIVFRKHGYRENLAVEDHKTSRRVSIRL